MAGKTMRSARSAKKTDRVTAGDWRLLICAAIILGAVGLKNVQGERADALRGQIQRALTGGISTSEALAVMGQTLEEGGLSQVFAPAAAWPKEARTDEDPEKTSGDDSTANEMQTGTGTDAFAQDILDRMDSQFPSEVDETVYILGLETAQPVVGTRSSGFGMRVNPISGKEAFHYGVDIAAPEGTDILSFAAGTVRETGNNSYGNYLIVDHADGLSTLYAHCSELLAAPGDAVACGQKIAEVGATGNATGNHLHIELWRAGKVLDPELYLSGI